MFILVQIRPFFSLQHYIHFTLIWSFQTNFKYLCIYTPFHSFFVTFNSILSIFGKGLIQQMSRVGKFCRSKKKRNSKQQIILLWRGKKKGHLKWCVCFYCSLYNNMVKKVKILDFARRSMVCRSTLGKVERMSEKWNGSAAPIITLPQNQQTPRN